MERTRGASLRRAAEQAGADLRVIEDVLGTIPDLLDEIEAMEDEIRRLEATIRDLRQAN